MHSTGKSNNGIKYKDGYKQKNNLLPTDISLASDIVTTDHH
jgi:hypothetical protein